MDHKFIVAIHCTNDDSRKDTEKELDQALQQALFVDRSDVIAFTIQEE